MSYKDNFKARMNDNTEFDHLKKNYIKRRERAEERTNAYAYFLSVVCDIIALLFFIYDAVLLGIIFIALGGLLLLLVYLTKKQDEKENKKEDKNSKKSDKKE